MSFKNLNNLAAQEKKNAAQAARPPPEQPAGKSTSAPLTPARPLPRARPASKADGRAATDDDSTDAAPVGQRVQPGRAKNLRHEDLEAYREGEANVAPQGEKPRPASARGQW